MEKRKLIIEDVDGTEYEVAGTGGDGGTVPANSVNSQSIEDGSVQKVDLDQEIQDKLDVIDDSNIVTEEELAEDWQEAMNQAGLDIDSDDSDSVSDEDLANDWQDAIDQAGEGSE